MWNPHSWADKRIRVNSGGYEEVYYPEHPNCDDEGYVLVHRLVMENHLERYLDSENEVVHHVDENKRNNNIWNLFLCNNEEHMLIHRLGKRHSRIGKSNISKKHKKISQRRKRNHLGQFIKDE